MKNLIFAITTTLLLFGCKTQYKDTDFLYQNGINSERQIPSGSGFAKDEVEWYLFTPDKVPIYVLEAGIGKNIFVLHGGFGMEHSYMRKALKSHEKDYHMIYYDQRGSLRSPIPKNKYKKYVTMDNMVNDLELLRTEIKEEKMTIIAHSMGAVLAYEYMRKYPNKVGNVIIISGFVPKFPVSEAGFHDLFTSQQERAEFEVRPSVALEAARLKTTMDTTSKAYKYMNWKLKSATCQVYDIENWEKVDDNFGFFNPKINKIIGPESNLPLSYVLKFFLYQRRFNKGKLGMSENLANQKSPIDYLPEIKNHPYKISYLLARSEFGDFNLRLYNRFLTGIENVDMHIFEKACHNIWMDQPNEFHQVVGSCLNELQNNPSNSKDLKVVELK